MCVGEASHSYGNSQLCPAAVRRGGRGKPQPWRAGAAAVRAMERFIASYGTPEPVQTGNGVEFTNRYTLHRCFQSGRAPCALFEQFLLLLDALCSA
jgi:hypothetical protein